MAARPHSSTIFGYPSTVTNVAPMRYIMRGPFAGRCYVKSIRFGGREIEDNLVDITGAGTLEIILALGARLTGTVVDRDGRPAARATVTLVPTAGRVSPLPSVQVITNGSFTISGIRPGSYRLFAWEDSLEMEPSPELLKAFEKRDISLTLSARESPEPVRIEVIPASESAKVSGLTAAPRP